MRPLRVRYSGANFQDLIEMTDAEIKTIYAYRLCIDFATNADTQGNLNIDGGTGTSIGTFVDTRRPDPVNTPVAVDNPSGTTTTSTTYTFKQVMTTGTVAITNRPVSMTVDNTAIIEMTDSDLNTAVMDIVIADMAAGNQVGQYQLKTSGAPVGGTWTSRGTFTDKTDDSTGNTTTTWTLWQKTVGTTPPSTADNRPLKWNTDGLKEMSDAEIQQQTMLMRNRIVNQATIATYKVQTAAPSPGTWVQMGDTVTDVIQDRQLVSGYFNIVSATTTGTGATVKLWIRTA
jgi:hypothetical protein